MIEFIKRHLVYVLLFLIALIFIFPYLQKGFILASGESQLYLNPSYTDNYSMWANKINFGTYSYDQNNILLFSLFWQLLSLMSFIAHPSILFTFLSFFMPSIIFVFCADGILSFKNKLYYLPAGIFYSYNVFRVLAPLNERLSLLFIFLPLFFLFFYKLLITRKWSNVFILGLLSFLSSSMGGNLPVFTIPYLTMFIVFIIFLFLSNHSFSDGNHKLFKQIAVVLFLFLCVNLFWIIPLYKGLILIYQNTQNGTSLFSALASGNFYDHFRLIGSWAWKLSYNISLYYVFSTSYYYFPVIASTYIIVIFSFLYVLDLRKNLLKILVLCLSLSAFLLLAGIKGPLGFIYQFLYNKLLIFKIYREPFTKFTPMLIFSMAFGLIYSIDYLKQKIRGINSFFLITLLSALILLNAYPLFTTQTMPIRKWNAGQSSAVSIVPEYWKQAKRYIEKDTSISNYLLFPLFNYGTSNNWVYGINVVGNVADYLIDKSNIRIWDVDNSFSGEVIKNIYSSKSKINNLSKYLGFLNTKYILQENDFEWRYSQAGNLSPSKSNSYLAAHGLRMVAEFGNLNLEYLKKIPNDEPDKKLRKSFYTELENKPALVVYKINERDFYPIVYSPQRLVMSSKKLDKLPEIVSNPQFINSAVFFKYQISHSQPLDSEIFKQKTGRLVTTNFIKISPTKYRVSVQHATGKIPLVFSQSYHSDWKLYPVRRTNNYGILSSGSLFETWFSKSVADGSHYIVNGFANSWIIDINKLCVNSSKDLCRKNSEGNYDVEFVIEFLPQRTFMLSLLVSFITAVMSFLIICYLRFKEPPNITRD